LPTEQQNTRWVLTHGQFSFLGIQFGLLDQVKLLGRKYVPVLHNRLHVIKALPPVQLDQQAGSTFRLHNSGFVAAPQHRTPPGRTYGNPATVQTPPL
jgi:hypothetical protein